MNQPVWEHLAIRIQRGDDEALKELYGALSEGIRFMLFRHLGPEDLDDKVHDVFITATESIRKGELREPARLVGYIHTIVKRQIAGHIDRAVNSRQKRVELDFDEAICDLRPDPEFEAMERQNVDLAWRVLQSLPKRDRELLKRFYLDEESVEQICRGLKLTETQFRVSKSRAKQRFGELGRRCLQLRNSGKL